LRCRRRGGGRKKEGAFSLCQGVGDFNVGIQGGEKKRLANRSWWKKEERVIFRCSRENIKIFHQEERGLDTKKKGKGLSYSDRK